MVKEVGEDVMIHIGADTSGVAEGFEKAGRATANFAEKTERRLKVMNKIKTNPAVTITDRASKPVETITKKLTILDKTKATPAVQIQDRISAPLKTIQGALGNLETKTKSAFNTLKTAATAGALAIAGLVGYSLKLTNDQEQAMIGFETTLGSAKKAQDMMSKLSTFAIKTPFEMSQLRDATSRLLAFGFAGDSIIPTLTAVGDAASGLGKGQAGVEQITLALGQMKAKTKVSGDEMLQLVEAGVPAWDILAKGMGKSTAEVMKLSEKGLIPANDAINTLVKGMESRFPNMMAKQSRTLGGLMSTLKDFFSLNILTSFGQGIADEIEKPLGRLTDKLTNNTAKLDKMKTMFHDMGVDIGNFAVSNFQKLYDWMDKLANDKKFQKLSFGDKIFVTFDAALDSLNNYISGKGGERIGETFTKLAEIGVKAWSKVLEKSFTGGLDSMFHGNFAAGAGQLLITNMLTGGLMLSGGAALGKGIYGKLKGGISKAGKASAAETIEGTTGRATGTATAEEVATKGPWVSRIAPAASEVATNGSWISKVAPVVAKAAPALKILGPAVAVMGEAASFTTAKNKTRSVIGSVGGLGGMWAGTEGGAAVGATIGSVVPGAGTVIGGAIGGITGGLAGYFGGKKLFTSGYDAFKGPDKMSKASTTAADKITKSGQTWADQQGNITTSNGFVINSQNDLTKSCATFSQAMDLASAKLVAMSGIQVVAQAASSVADFKQMEYGRYASGNILTRPHLGLVAEAGPEAIIPLSARMRSRALGLWQETGRQLGVSTHANGGVFSSRSLTLYNGGQTDSNAVVGNSGTTINYIYLNGKLEASITGSNADEVAKQAAEIVAENIKAELENLA